LVSFSGLFYDNILSGYGLDLVWNDISHNKELFILNIGINRSVSITEKQYFRWNRHSCLFVLLRQTGMSDLPHSDTLTIVQLVEIKG